MIKIKMYQNKWRIDIEDEEWETETLEELKVLLEQVLNLKNKFGRVK